MKAERRHELQQNSLARFIDNFPVMVRLYADRILLVIVLILLVIVLIRWRMNAAVERANSVARLVGDWPVPAAQAASGDADGRAWRSARGHAQQDDR